MAEYETNNPQLDENIKIEKAKEKRARPYLETITSNRNEDNATRERQVTILKELPDLRTFSKILFAQLKANKIEFPDNTTPDRNIIQGFLFEELVKIENLLFDLSNGTSTLKQKSVKFTDLEKGSVESGLDEQITMLLHNALRFNYQELANLKNPDISFVETDIDGKVLRVIGVGEAKSSRKLDRRCFYQFKSFHRNISKVADFVNNRDDCEHHGLKYFGNGPDKTSIVINDKEKFAQYLIVTNDMDTDIQTIQKNFKTSGEGALNETEANDFEEMIRNGEIKIIRSAFSHNELVLLVNKIESIINNEIEEELQKYQRQQESQ